MTDTLGRTWTTTFNSSNVTYCPVSASYSTLFDTPGPNGTTREFKLCYSSHTIATTLPECGSGTCIQWAETVYFITGVVLPDLTTWKFVYDNDGDITQVFFPTGGSITYTWGTSWSATTSTTYSLARNVTSRTLYDGTNSRTWNYANSGPTNPTVTDPLGNDTVYTPDFSTGDLSDDVTQVQYYTGTGGTRTLLKTVTNKYLWLDDPYALDFGNDGGLPIFQSATTTWANGQTSTVQDTYDAGFTFNDTNPGDSGYGPFSSIYGLVQSESHSDYYTGNPSSMPWLSTANTAYYALKPANSSYLSANLLSLPLSKTVTDINGNLCAETDYSYDDSGTLDTYPGTLTNIVSVSTPRGNLSSAKPEFFTSPCTSTSPSETPYPTTVHTYNSGMMHTSTDPLSNATTYLYSSTYYGAYPTTVTNAKSQSTTYTYDSNTGQTLTMTDPNSQETIYTWDNMLRPLTVTYPDTGETSITYNYSGNVYIGETITKKINSLTNATTTEVTDGLGRGKQTRMAVQSSTTCSSGYSYVDTTYDGDGRTFKVSNPDCTSTSSDDVNTTYYYDALGRPCLTVPQDGTAISGSSCPTSRPTDDVFTTYSGNCFTTYDEAGNVRENCTDGMGRVTQVFEPNPTSNSSLIYETDYTYDPNSNLTYAQQKGNDSNSSHWRPRTFTYDSLSRLTLASNPESGTICYGTYSGSTCQQNGYDADGNLITKINARGITINYSPSGSPIDALGRVTEKTYSDSTPTVNFVYDACPSGGCPSSISPQNAVGRLVAAYTSGTPGTKSFYSYDPMGRSAEEWQCTPLNCGTSFISFTYLYNGLGEQTSASYNGSFTVSQAYDTAGLDYQLTSTVNNSQNPGTLATVSSFTPGGLPQVTSLGNGLRESIVYNSRLQPCRINVQSSSTGLTACTGSAPSGNIQDFQFGYNSGTSNNGNLASWAGAGQQTITRSYGYDTLNRISTFSDAASGATCTGLSWSFDPWANRTAQTVTGGTCNSFSASYSPSSNQITNTGFVYDAAGDLTNDGTYTYSYDAENRLTGAAGATYLYDANGRRVEKIASGQVHYFYDASGNVAIEENGSGSVLTDYLYMDGRYVAEYSGSQTYFIHRDHLGSTRVVTNYAGSPCSSIDYMPFGEQTISGSCTPTHRFTGKERDSESGLDNFGARYNSSQYGRFMSPDPANIKADVEDFSDPQGWNGYAYVRNNPLNLTDPDGQSYQVCVPDDQNQGQQKCTTVSDAQFSDLQRNPGSGISLRNGDVYGTDTNGNQTKVGSYVQTDVDLPPGVGDMLHQAGTMSDAGVKAAMILTAPEYLVAAGGAAAVELAGQSSLSVFEGAEVAVKDHALRHLASDALKSQAKAAIQQAINSGQIRYISGGTFIGRVLVQGQEYVFTGAFQNGVAQVGRITEQIRDSLGRFLQ